MADLVKLVSFEVAGRVPVHHVIKGFLCLYAFLSSLSGNNMWVQFVGHITFLLIAFSYTLRDMVWLRLVAVFASCTSIVFNFVAPETPLWLVINWNIVFLGVNLFELIRIYRENRTRKLTQEESRLAATIFRNLSSLEAARLVEIAMWRTVDAGDTLVREGEQLRSIVFIAEGYLSVSNRNGSLIQRGPGSFVGEVSFVTGQPASATVTATTELRCLCWSFEALHALMAKHPQISLVLQRIICADLSEKLRDQPCESNAENTEELFVIGS